MVNKSFWGLPNVEGILTPATDFKDFKKKMLAILSPEEAANWQHGNNYIENLSSSPLNYGVKSQEELDRLLDPSLSLSTKAQVPDVSSIRLPWTPKNTAEENNPEGGSSSNTSNNSNTTDVSTISWEDTMKMLQGFRKNEETGEWEKDNSLGGMFKSGLNSLKATFSGPKDAETMNTFSNFTNQIGNSMSAGSGAYDGEHGHLASSVNTGINTAVNMVGDKIPYLKKANAVGNAFNGLSNLIVGSLDNVNKTDAIMSAIPGIGGVYNLFGKKTDKFSTDNDTKSKVGAAYGGAYDQMDNASKLSNKRMVAGRSAANKSIRTANSLQDDIRGISAKNDERLDLREGGSKYRRLNRQFNMNGGYDQRYASTFKKGGKLDQARQILKCQKGQPLSDPYSVYLQSLPDYQRTSEDFRVRDYWEYNGRPKDFNEAISKGMFHQLDDGWHANSVQMNPETGEIEFMKSSKHPNHHMETEWYNSNDPEAVKFRNEWELVKTEPYWKYVHRKVQKKQQGGIIIPAYDEWVADVNPDLIPQDYDLQTAYSNLPWEQIANWKYAMNSGMPDFYMDFVDNDGNRPYQLPTVIPIKNSDDYMFLRLGNESPEVLNEVQAYQSGANNLLNTYDLIYDGDRFYYRKRPVVIEQPQIIEQPEVIAEFKEGGSFNVIPSGALHARKHNMDVEGITRKGIPVVSGKGDTFKQQAEIERDEIILRLEVTRKLEDASEKYYDEGTPEEEKEQLAIECGEMMIDEILNNTKDNTGILNSSDNDRNKNKR